MIVKEAMRHVAFLATLFAFTVPAAAADRCSVVATKLARADGHKEAFLKPGDSSLSPVTQKLVRKDGTVWYCAHGDYCYPADAFRLTSACSFKQSTIGIPDPDETTYEAW